MRRAAPAWSCCARSSGERQGSLLAAIDRTSTGPGARELAARLSSPLRDPERDRRAARCGRLPARGRDAARRSARPRCGPRPTSPAPSPASPCSAGDRATSAPCATGWRPPPRARACCARAPAASACRRRSPASPSAWPGAAATLPTLLARALVDEPPHQRRDGGFVRAGFRADLDEARAPARRQPQGDGGAGGQVPRGDRHQVAEGAAQQHPGLLHRGAGRRRPSRC